MTKTGLSLDIEQIRMVLPHRAPMLLVERITDMVPFESGIGWKAVGYNEPWFAGHFPEYPVMPGGLVVEALGRPAGALVVHSLGAQVSGKVYFLTIDKARFRKPVRPGDLMRMPVKAIRRRGPVFKFEGQAYVGEDLCAEAEFSAMVADENQTV